MARFDLSRFVHETARYGQLQGFVKESNKIEGISGASTAEIAAHLRLLDRNRLTTRVLTDFVSVVQPGASLRRKAGQNVVVVRHGSVVHRALPGGPEVGRALTNLIKAINAGQLSPHEAHLEYETLHPFTDGNGRSGRAIWLWQVQRQEPLRDPFAVKFLDSFYYDALKHSR